MFSDLTSAAFVSVSVFIFSSFGSSSFGSSSFGSCIFCSIDPDESSTEISGAPVLTSSPALTNTSLTTPASSAGISILALSDSRTKIISSIDTESPGLIKISLTSAESIPSPKSGSNTSFNILHFYWTGLVWINVVLFYYFVYHFHFYISLICQRPHSS